MFGILNRLFGQSADLGELLTAGAVIVDVRTPAEYNGGHAKDAINIPLDRIAGSINKLKAYQKPIITCCASGARSGAAADLLRSAGLEVTNGGPWQNVARAQTA